MNNSNDLVNITCELLECAREQRPLVHCITNTVVTGYTANCLLAFGVSPAMIDDPVEAAQFAAIANALLINTGTITKNQAEAMHAAVGSAINANKPWVLDPVATGFLKLRTETCAALKNKKPSIIRGNASEIIALAGFESTSRGVDSTADVDNAVEAAKILADETGASILVTGPTDCVVTQNTPVVAISNGHPVMTRVTGVGCAQGAIAAALAAVAEDTHSAAVATGLILSIAGEIAARRTVNPGSYQIALLDALNDISSEEIHKRARISS